MYLNMYIVFLNLNSNFLNQVHNVNCYGKKQIVIKILVAVRVQILRVRI